MAILQDHYRTLAQREKLEKENKRYIGRSKLSYMQLSDKYGLTAAVARRRAGLPPLTSSLPYGIKEGNDGADGDGKQAEPAPAVAKDISEIEVLDEEAIFGAEGAEDVAGPDLRVINGLMQRLAQV